MQPGEKHSPAESSTIFLIMLLGDIVIYSISTLLNLSPSRILSSQLPAAGSLPRLATGRATDTKGHSRRLSDRSPSLRPSSFRGSRGRALHLKLCILFAHATSEITKLFMSSLTRAEGYDTPAQQSEDSTTFI